MLRFQTSIVPTQNDNMSERVDSKRVHDYKSLCNRQKTILYFLNFEFLL